MYLTTAEFVEITAEKIAHKETQYSKMRDITVLYKLPRYERLGSHNGDYGHYCLPVCDVPQLM
jgi:hypothetical protein